MPFPWWVRRKLHISIILSRFTKMGPPCRSVANMLVSKTKTLEEQCKMMQEPEQKQTDISVESVEEQDQVTQETAFTNADEVDESGNTSPAAQAITATPSKVRGF